MRLPNHISSKTSGFTLIELLIVIGILGILAAGLLAALDPLEQARKARDSNRRSGAEEVANGLERYYANAASFPWGTVATGPSTLPAGIITTLVNVGELKQGFTMPAQPASTGYILYGDANGGVYVCFDPEARTGNVDQNSTYTDLTTAPPAQGAACPGDPGPCYFCAR